MWVGVITSLLLPQGTENPSYVTDDRYSGCLVHRNRHTFGLVEMTTIRRMAFDKHRFTATLVVYVLVYSTSCWHV